MSARSDGYMTSPEWSELSDAEVLGRPIKVWRRRPRTVGELMTLCVGQDDQEFLVQGGRRFTYGTFRRAVEAGAEWLAAAGVERGSRLMIVLYNSPEFWLLQCAAWRLGAVPVLGNRWWSAQALEDAVRRMAPRLVATDMPLRGGQPVRLTPVEIAAWWSLPDASSPVPSPDHALDEDDVAVIVFTAGSTGAPKSVQLSHRALVWTLQTIQVMRGGRPLIAAAPGRQKVALTTTPLFHNGGMVATLGTHIDGGRIIFLEGRFDPAEVLRLIEIERVTSWSAVPTMFNRLLRHPDLAHRDLSSLTATASGGAAVSGEFVAELASKLPQAAAGFSSGYGMTEMSFLTMVGAAELAKRPGTVGRLVPSVEMRVEDATGAGTGELVARSGALMIGYSDSDEQPIDEFGWYKTGDVGWIDADGYVFLTGRSKDMVIRGGENISCQQVEAALLTHRDVLEAAVVGVPDQEFGEAIAAILYLRPSVKADTDELTRYAKTRLAYFEVPTRWIFRQEPLPVLPTGKIDKPSLRREIVSS